MIKNFIFYAFLIILTALALYVICPKWYFSREPDSLLIFRYNKITGETHLLTTEKGWIKTQ